MRRGWLVALAGCSFSIGAATDARSTDGDGSDATVGDGADPDGPAEIDAAVCDVRGAVVGGLGASPAAVVVP